MIRINLLPVRQSRKREAGKQWIVLFAITFLAAVVGNYLWWSETEKNHEAIKSRIAQYQQDVATLNKIIGEVKNIKAQKAEMEKKLETLKKLRDGRTGPVRVMDELANIIPQRVWITNYEDAGGSVAMAGSAGNHEEVSTFLKKLKASKFFSAPVLKYTRQAAENRVEFQISAGVRYDVPQG